MNNRPVGECWLCDAIFIGKPPMGFGLYSGKSLFADIFQTPAGFFAVKN
jgi:hypothetical protein